MIVGSPKIITIDMVKRLTILISAFFISAVSVTSGLDVGTTSQRLLWDGFFLRGIDGKVSCPDSNEGWFFEFDCDVSDGRGRVPAETSLSLLPSTALEKMVADANDRAVLACKLWGRATKYKGRNFIFPTYLLPLSKSEPLNSLTPQQIEEKTQPTIGDPNDELDIPKEILEKLKTRRTIYGGRSERQIKIKQNSVLTNRTGFLVRQADGSTVFDLDALGWNAEQICFRLLPCEALERAEQEQSAEPDPIRLKIAGIITDYKGNKYLLLHKATRVYSHGNFGR